MEQRGYIQIPHLVKVSLHLVQGTLAGPGSAVEMCIRDRASSVKKVIGVVSGKGGVGKSLVTSMMAVSMNRKGRKTAILDADITGPSIPMAFGIGNELSLIHI